MKTESIMTTSDKQKFNQISVVSYESNNYAFFQCMVSHEWISYDMHDFLWIK